MNNVKKVKIFPLAGTGTGYRIQLEDQDVEQVASYQITHQPLELPLLIIYRYDRTRSGMKRVGTSYNFGTLEIQS